ncbi:MAG TPA: right-handed parallel beta-helix repeat-containing protein [Bacteroidetes bacterium]|nr:hypothetical protein BMS3Bbin04_01619 [bacterium BMS3Bbin04]HDO66026.1 right-handed parallel beta-helix repeat-containing protein [Bacteroidota bacterium]HEX05151.1 right-handed parallel beta-helix repeat-containing protein [Bacteroidota bacterium]
MKNFIKTLCFCAMIIMVISPAFATTHNVPADFNTIQSGLDASASGDTVLVQPGTYYENIDWPDINGIKLIAAGIACIYNSNPTIINCTLDGNSVGEGGGGVACSNSSSPTIINSSITNNTGEGIDTNDVGSIPEITFCDVYNNSGGNYMGPGINPFLGLQVFINANGDSAMHG